MYFLNSKKLFKLSHLFSKIFACNFSTKNPLMVECLKKRTLLKLSGSETNNYIQSMMTNDISNFETLPALYSLLLNSRGRVLYDIILYKLCNNEYLVEYDSTAVEYLERHLIMYRLRKDVKIQIHPTSTNLTPWVIYPQIGDQIDHDFSKLLIDKLKGTDGIVKVVEDPRIKELGIRVIANESVELPKVLPSDVNCKEDDSYRLLRYKLGVGEGVLDHPPGECTPFDINVDLLNGVSFTKGCYIGQEMTARSRHVFIIRKRLMPVILQKLDSYPIFPPECDIVNESNQKLGRLRSHLGQHGLGFLKFEDCAKSNILKLKDFDVTLETTKPKWWPNNLKSEKQ